MKRLIPLLLLSGSVLAEDCATVTLEYQRTEGWTEPNKHHSTIVTHGVGVVVLEQQYRQRDSITIIDKDTTYELNNTNLRIIMGNRVMFPGAEIGCCEDYKAEYKICPDGSLTNIYVK